MVLTKVSLERPSPLPLTRIFKLGILQQVQDKFCGFKNSESSLRNIFLHGMDSPTEIFWSEVNGHE